MIRLTKILSVVVLSLWGFSSALAAESASQKRMKLQYYYLEALRQRQAGDVGAAVDNLYRCNSLDNNNSEVFSALADINMDYSYTMAAVGQMRKAIELEPHNIDYKVDLANYLVNVYELREAAELYETLVKEDHKRKNIYYYYLANIYSTMNEYEKAIGAWNAFEGEEGISETVTVQKFKLYLKLKKEKKAFSEVDKLIKSAPKETKFIAMKGDLYLAVGDQKKGEQCYLKGLKDFPDDPLLKVQYGYFLNDVGRKKEGMEKLLSVLRDPKVDYVVKHDLLLRLTGDSTMKVDDSYYLDVIKQYPNEEYPSLVYSTVLLERGDTTCISYIRNALSINPKHEDAWLLLIKYYLEKGDTTRFVNAAQESIEQFPESASLLDIRGMAHIMQKENDEALKVWRGATRYAVESGDYALASELFAKVADMLMQKNQEDSCFAMMDSSLTYAPNNVMALNNYAYYLSIRNRDLDKAEKMSLQTLKSNPKSPVFLDTYAWICFKRGEYNIAKLYIQQAYLYGGKDDPELLEHYGDIMFKSGTSASECQKYWKEALEKRDKLENPRDYINYDNLKHKAETGEYVE
ncbi:MAG: tetratricopeptide repeat protein [Paludibacteraceae bacterium]|nr:tetratricopeptide repeat protein [Paludibacteraceae bacterium]